MPVKYIPYYPETIEGQAILNNITRTQRVLRYRENDKVYDRIKRGMPYYEAETIETVGSPSDNLVIRGECISACAYLKEKGIKVDLVYIDPPFASGADYAKNVYIRKNPKIAELIAGAEQEMDIEEFKAFEEKMYGDIWQKEDYLNWMYENLMAIKAIMSENGSIYVHLDTKIGHYVKILMDEIFGEENFINEIIWHYNKFAGKATGFHSNHDIIFYYSVADKPVFNKIRIPVAKERKQTARIWDSQLKKAVQKKNENGDLIYYDQLDKGVDDTWNDIPLVNPMAEERYSVDYATQKPQPLLERIISVSSNKNMIVADFFGGSGVTAKAANTLGCKFIHCDIGINSIQTAREGLKDKNANFKIVEIKDGVSLFRNPQQTMDKLKTIIPGLQTQVSGLNKFWFGAVTDSKNGTVPVYMPNLLNTQEKILDIPAINTIINQELQNLEDTIKKVIVYYIDADDISEIERFIRHNNATEIEVELRDLKNLLHEVVIEDILEYQLVQKESIYETEITSFSSDRLLQKINEFNQKGNLQSLSKGKKFNPISISEEGLELIELIALDCENEDGEWRSTTEIKIDKLGYVIKDGVKSKNFWDGKIMSAAKPKRLKIRNISGDETVVVVFE